MYDSYKDMALDEALDNQDLRGQLKELQAERNELKRENCDLRMQIMFARQKLRHDHATTNPVDVGEEKCECSQCCLKLADDWEFCPGCGKYIDWDALEVPEDDRDNWYEEEGNRFLQAAVYDPIRERWGE